MTKEEIMEVREHMESIRVNCEAAIAENPADEYAQSNWQHVTAALELLRTQKGNPASAENGKKGGRPKSRYITRDREAGNRIEGFSTLDEAKAAIRAYEAEDRQQGTYEPDFYEVAELRGDYYETVE